MAADLGLSPENLETDGFPKDEGEGRGSVSRSGLMERLRCRYGQHRSWTDTIKAIRLAQMNDKRLQSVAMEKSSLQSCLDTLHRALKITNHQSLVDRLDLIARQLGMILTPPSASDGQVTLSADMFKVVVVLENGQNRIRDVRIGHHGVPTSCEELVEVLSNGRFDEFIEHLQGLQSIYSIPGDKTQKKKAFLALDSLETDLNLLAQLQSSINGVANYIHKSPLGILLPRRGGHPMKLIYYVSPYDLLCKRSNKSHPMTLEAITDHNLGHSVTVCLEPSLNNNKLQTMPLNSVKSNLDGKNLPSFQGVNNINSCSLSASFVLVLPEPIPVCKSVILAIQAITGLDVTSDVEGPFLDVLLQQCSGSQLRSKRELFVTLPDQQHVYYLNCGGDGVLGGAGCLLRKVPFTHPTSVPRVLSLLRQQLVFNSVLRSIVRPSAKRDHVSSVVFEMTAVTLQYVCVMFEHPLSNSIVTVEFNLSDITNVKCSVCTGNSGDGICTDDFVSRAFQRCFSIPVTLRSVIKRVQAEIRQLSAPEPVKQRTVKTRLTWTKPKPPIKAPAPPVSVSPMVSPASVTSLASHINTSTSAVPSSTASLTLSSFPNPPPYPGIDSWSSHSPAISQVELHKYSVGFNRPFADTQATMSVSETSTTTSMSASHDHRPPANPLLATLLDTGSPSVAAEPIPSVITESPMLSKLLEDNTSVATNPFPAPNPRKRLTKRKSSKDMLAGKSPKHRVSDSDMADRTSERVNSERHGQGIGEKHIDLDSSGGSYDEPVRPSSVSSVSSTGGQSTGSVIDLTDIGESHVKKLENSLDSIMGKESPHSSGAFSMNSQFSGMDPLDINLNFSDLHSGVPNSNNMLLGDPGGMEFQPPLQWGARQTPPTPTSRNSPHHGVSVPKNEKISTSLEDLLHFGPRGREKDGPSAMAQSRRNSQNAPQSLHMTPQTTQQRRASFKRQCSTGRNSMDSMSGGISPSLDVFSPFIPSLASPTQLTLSSPSYAISPSSGMTLMSPSQLTAISPQQQQQNLLGKLEASLGVDSKPGTIGSHSSTANATTPRVNSALGHITSAGKPSLSMLKAQLEMTNEKCSYSAITQEKDCLKDELSSSSNASTNSQPPSVKLKLSNMRGFDSVSQSDSEDGKMRGSSMFDFHSDDEEFTLPMVEKLSVVSASPTRLQISNKSQRASFNKFNKSEKFKRKQQEKEFTTTLSLDSGKRKRDREENKKEKKKKKLNSYSVDKDVSVYKSTAIEEGGNENDHYKPMPKLKINLKKKGVKLENSVLQVKEEKDKLDKNNVKLVNMKELKPEEKIVNKLEKEAIVKIEKVEKQIKKSEKDVNSIRDGEKTDRKKEKSADKTGLAITRTPSASDHEGIFDKINAMKTENLPKNEDATSSLMVDRKPSTDSMASSASSSSHRKLSSSKSLKSHKRSNSKSDSKIAKTPTIKLKPITLPTNSSSANAVSTAKTPSTPGTPVTPKSVAQSPTSATIGKIGAVSLATSGSQKQLPTSSSGKSPQSSNSSASKSGSSKSSSTSSSSKLGSNLQKSIQIQGPGGKNSPVPQNSKTNHSRSLSTSSFTSGASSIKGDKSLNKSLTSGSSRTSSPSLEKEKSKSVSGSSRSTSSSSREKSTSSSKTSVPVTTVITQESAASVLSFLNPKANKINSFTIPKLSSNTKEQKASTPTSVNSPTIVSTSVSTSVTSTTTSSSTKFTKGLNQTTTTTSSSKGGNLTVVSPSVKNNSPGLKNSYNKANSGSRSQNPSVANAANSSRTGNNSPNSYSQKSNNAYNKGNNSSNSSSNQNSGFRNYNSGANSANQKMSNSNQNWNNSANSGTKVNHNSTQNQNVNRGSNSSSGSSNKSANVSGNSSNFDSSGNSNNARPSQASNIVSNPGQRASNTAPNAPKGPGPPVTSSLKDSGNKTKTGAISTQQAAARGRKGSLSAVIDKLTCKASGPNVLPTTSASLSSKPVPAMQQSEVIVNESPASPEMDAPVNDPQSEERKVVIFDAPASPEPEISGQLGSHDSKPTCLTEIVSIPLENRPNQTVNESDFSHKDSSSQLKHPVTFNSPKTIPLNSPNDVSNSASPTVNCNKPPRQNSVETVNSISQQNGDISNDLHNDHHHNKISNHKNESCTPTKTKEAVFKVPTPKRQDSIDTKPGDDSSDGTNARRKSRSDYSSVDSPPSSPENGLIIDFSPSALAQHHQNKSPTVCNSIISNANSSNCSDSTIRSNSPLKSSSPVLKPSPGLKLAPTTPVKVRASPMSSPGGRDTSSAGSNPSSPVTPADDLDLMDEALGLGN